MIQDKANLIAKEDLGMAQTENDQSLEDTEIKLIRELEEALGEKIFDPVSLTELL